MAKKQEYLYDSVLVIIKNSWFATLDKAAMLGGQYNRSSAYT